MSRERAVPKAPGASRYAAPHWRLRDRSLALDRPRLVGIVNVTPDSFSDGGRHATPDEAVAHGSRLLDEGADVLDVGGESTRPQGARPVGAEEERRRILPVIRGLRALHDTAVISVDTVKADVAAAALAEGADIVNDVSGFRLDPRMGEICAAASAGVVLMHSRGGVADMATYAHASYGSDVVGEVVAELAARLEAARAAGVAEEAIVLDPGLGFAKRSEHSLALLGGLPRLTALGRPLLVGASRKRFIGEITGVTEPADRVDGTVGAHVAALALGAWLFRVHDVRAHRHALDVAWAVFRERAS